MVLRYGALSAHDAAGESLPAWMHLVERGVELGVDASRAAYPITIDPLSTTPDWTAQGNQTTAYFGYSVGTAGDVNGDGYSDVIVGAYLYDQGQTDRPSRSSRSTGCSTLAITASWSPRTPDGTWQKMTTAWTGEPRHPHPADPRRGRRSCARLTAPGR